MIFIIFLLIIIISFILYIINNSLKKKEYFDINLISYIEDEFSFEETISNMYLFVCADNYAQIKINGKYIKKTLVQSGYNNLGSYFLENISKNDQITIDILNNNGNGGGCISYIWNKQLYILDENAYDKNANIINYNAIGNNGWSNKIATLIDHILPWMKNWITMDKSLTISFKIGDNKNKSILANDMIVFLGIDDQGTVKLNNTLVYTKNQPWTEVVNFTIPSVNNGDNLSIDCANLGGSGGISLTYLWRGYVYAFPSTFEGLNSVINIINFNSNNTTSFTYCNYLSSLGYMNNCDFMSGALMFNGGNWLRACDGNCNFSFNTIISKNVKNSWIYDKTINTWYETVKNNLIGKWSELKINSNAFMTISFYLKLELNKSDSKPKNIFHLSNQNANCCQIGNNIPGLYILSNKIYLMSGTSKSNINISIEISNKESFITLLFFYNTIKIYLNGKISSNKLYSEPLEIANPDAYFYISDPWNDGGINIKDFTIYNYILSDKEIENLYNNINNGLINQKIESEVINNTPSYIELPIISKNLKAYFSLNESTLEIISNTTNKYACDIKYKTIKGKTGIICNGSTYNELSTDYIINYNIPNFSINASNGVTISIWFYGIGLSNDTSIQCLFNLTMKNNDTEKIKTEKINSSNSIGYGIGINNKGFFIWCENSSSEGYNSRAYNNNITINNNRWYNLIMTFDSKNQINGYLDGNILNLTKSNTNENNINSLNITSSNNQFNIGSSPSSVLKNNFLGYLSKIGIYNNILNMSDLTTLYNAG